MEIREYPNPEDYISSDDGLLSSVEKNGNPTEEDSCDPVTSSLHSIGKKVSITSNEEEFEPRCVNN